MIVKMIIYCWCFLSVFLTGGAVKGRQICSEGRASGGSRWWDTEQGIYPGLGPPGGGKTLFLPLVFVLLGYSPAIREIAGEIYILGYSSQPGGREKVVGGKTLDLGQRCLEWVPNSPYIIGWATITWLGMGCIWWAEASCFITILIHLGMPSFWALVVPCGVASSWSTTFTSCNWISNANRETPTCEIEAETSHPEMIQRGNQQRGTTSP